MRSLNTSLPKSSSRRQKPSHPPAGLQQAFKAAAYSVTQLYKAASADEDTARAAGYQDAIDELLAFLDAENLGVGDGEGWRVRQWATERLTPEVYASEDDAEEDSAGEAKTTTQTRGEPSTSDQSRNHPRKGKETTGQKEQDEQTAPAQSSPPDAADQNTRQPEMFRFTANPQSSDMDLSSTSPTQNNMPPPTSIRLNVQPTRQRSRQRPSHDRSQRSPPLGHGAGLKRKTSGNFDWIDFAGIGRDWHGHGPGGGLGGAKRGRWSE